MTLLQRILTDAGSRFDESQPGNAMSGFRCACRFILG